jgi:O-antigen/teichoic acid export membrane protein
MTLSHPARRLRVHLAAPVYRSTYALIASTGITAALGVAFWAVSARLYDASDVGLAVAAVSAMTLVASLSQLNASGGLARFIPESGQDAERLVAGAYVMVIGTGLLAGVAVALIASLAGSGSFVSGPLWFRLLFIASIPLATVFVVQDSVLVAVRASGIIPLENGLFGLAKLALVIAFAATSLHGAIFVAWAISLFGTVVPINAFLFGRALPRHRATKREPISGGLRRVVSFTAGTYVASAVQLGANALLPLIVVARTDLRSTAYFYPAWIIAITLEALLANLTTVVTVEGARDAHSLARVTAQARRVLTRAIVPLLLVLALAAQPLLTVFGSNYASNGTELLRLLVLASAIRATCVIRFGVARVRELVRLILITNVAASIVLVAGAWVLLPPLGLIGAGWAYVAEQVVAALVLMRFVEPVPAFAGAA